MAENRSTVLVVGLGRFGTALALELESLGHEVLAMDARESVVQQWASRITHAVQGDSTDHDTLISLGVKDLAHAVVAIGEDVEASILTTSALSELGVTDVWAKATSAAHARILGLVGATHVVYPEQDSGRRLAHLVTGRVADYMEIDDDFVLIETGVPSNVHNQTLADAQLRAAYGVTVVSVKPPGGRYTYATPSTVLDGLLLVAGTKADVARFAAAAPDLG